MKDILLNDEWKVGKLFLEGKEIDIYTDTENSNLLLDKGTGNCHFLPDNPETAKYCAERILEVKKCIASEWQKNQKDESSLSKSKGILILDKEEKYENSTHNIFHYLRYTKGEKIFEIIFIRFYKEENTINCILNCLQFCAYIGDVKSIDLYPYSAKDGSGYRDTMGNVYYNPHSRFNDKPEDIVNEFMDFIERNSDKKSI